MLSLRSAKLVSDLFKVRRRFGVGSFNGDFGSRLPSESPFRFLGVLRSSGCGENASIEVAELPVLGLTDLRTLVIFAEPERSGSKI